jgi:hypothetical protein
MPADHLHALLTELKALGVQGIDALKKLYAGTAIEEIVEQDVALRLAGTPQESAKEAEEKVWMWAVRIAGTSQASPEEIKNKLEEEIRTHLQMMKQRNAVLALSDEAKAKCEKLIAGEATSDSLCEDG